MINLSESVRLVCLRFAFSNPQVVPETLKRLKQEMPKLDERQHRPSGTLVIKPTANCYCDLFPMMLESANYELVDAFYNNCNHQVVRFLFVRRKFANISDEFKELRQIVGLELRDLLNQALWRVRAFLNPVYQNGEEVFGQNSVSVNFEARQPRFYADGQRVRMWRKDENGQRVGDHSVPVLPDYNLVVISDAIMVVDACHTA